MRIALDLLENHPGNANRMSQAMLDKLVAHIGRSGHYPPLIVRPHPGQSGRFQVLDGHHRLVALRRLSHHDAACEVWDVDDQQATELLLTLNRLHGEDDPFRRASLLERLRQSLDMSELAARLPEDAQRIQKLLALNAAPPALATPPDLGAMPHAVTFFLSASQRQRLFDKLKSIAPDRSGALITLLELGS